MGKQLTDKQRKQVIAEYIQCQNYSEVARKFKVTVNTVKNIILKDPRTAKLCKYKKEENLQDILAYMDTKKNKVCNLIDTYLDALLDPNKIKKSTTNQLSTALGTVIDKFTMNTQNDTALNKLDELVKKIDKKSDKKEKT